MMYDIRSVQRHLDHKLINMPSPSSALTLIVRFSTSLPDLVLFIPVPSATNTATVSTLIRPHLPPNLSSCPLRLIYGGAILSANTPLSTSLRISTSANSKLPPQFYVHCSISTDAQLSPADLTTEALIAPLPSPSSLEDHDASRNEHHAPRPQEITQVQPPQGFDRLLSAGLSPTEVASLRSQFLAIQSHTHTPDTMPSAAELRGLEERWLDAGTPMHGGGAGSGSLADDEAGGGLEDMLWGNIMGFFWAVGAIVWLCREEGVWSKRRQIGVVTGVLVNVAFCILRTGS